MENNQLSENDKLELLQKKRLKIIGVIFIIASIAMISRVFYIQVVKNKDFAKRAVQQRMVTIPIAVNRGEIYDRNMIAFTDRESKKVIIVYPAYIYDKKVTAETIARACGITVEEVLSKLKGGAATVEFIVKGSSNQYLELIDNGMIKGVISVEKKLRYTENSLARHIIGYIGKSDKTGFMGLEKSMNNLLAGSGEDSIAAVVDSSKKIIPGLGFRKIVADRNGESFSLKLTLDYHIQKIIEDVMRKNKINGSVVVMDIKNGDILGMASLPDFEQSNLNKYINTSGDELINKSIWQFDFGSIFKTVVAAAAIENNIVSMDEKFLCEGNIVVGNNTINCSSYKSHENREINLKEAFALSCNTTFVKIGTRVGAEKILDMASRLGFGQKQCDVLLEEKAGYIPTAKEDGIGNISIGQGKIQVTPLQVTTMMAAIANNGIRYSPNLVEQLMSSAGVTIKTMEKSKPEIVISPSTAQTLKELLSEVTKTGTGKQANMDEYGGSSGKTSSAQTGISKGEVVHGWFAGYVPSNEPKYAITVFIYNGQSGGGSAAPIFKEIATGILDNVKR